MVNSVSMLSTVCTRVVCYVSIVVDAVHCPPLDSDAGGGHFRYTHRSGSSRRSCENTIISQIIEFQ